VIAEANILFCIYGDMGKVVENACTTVNASPSFLQHNKQKAIKLSTLKNKLTEWQRDVRSERDAYQMGADAFYDLVTHSDSTKLAIQIVRMQDVALQRQDRERMQADPARHDLHLAQAVRIPVLLAAPHSQHPPAAAPQSQIPPAAAPQSQIPPAAAPQSQNSPAAAPQLRNPPVYPDTVEGRFMAAQAHYAAIRDAAPTASRSSSRGGRGGRARTATVDASLAEAVYDAVENSQASHPAAVAPNTIQVWSGSHGSSNARKRLMAVAGGENVPTAQRPSIEGFLPNFIESANAYRSAQEIKSNAAMLGAATTFIEYARNLPANDPLRQDLLTLGVQKARLILQVNPADVPLLPGQPSMPPPPPPGIPVVQQPAHFEPLECSICYAHFEINPLRGTYANAIFTHCQHAFHPACLAEHRRTQIARAGWRPVKCPNCNENLQDEMLNPAIGEFG
jgi:hypothetical protein